MAMDNDPTLALLEDEEEEEEEEGSLLFLPPPMLFNLAGSLAPCKVQVTRFISSSTQESSTSTGVSHRPPLAAEVRPHPPIHPPIHSIHPYLTTHLPIHSIHPPTHPPTHPLTL